VVAVPQTGVQQVGDSDMNTMRTGVLLTFFVLILTAATMVGCQAEAPPATASITGGVFFDCNRDGTCNQADCGIKNVDIRLYRDACGGDLLQTAKTHEDGSFAFPDLAPGAYCVFLDAKLETCGYEANFPTNAISRKTVLKPGDKVVLHWFGLTRLGDGVSEPLSSAED
jgi:hypothetical protein